MSKKYFIGLSSTFHDSSISIIDESGSIIFAENTERYLQNKKAIGCIADSYGLSDKILKEYCDTNAEFHIATSWGKNFVNFMKYLNLLSIFNKVPESKISTFFFNKILQSNGPDSNFILGLKMNLASNVQAGAGLEWILRFKYNNEKIIRHQFNHHLTHAACGAFTSTYDDALCLVVDGMGEIGTISYYEYKNGKIIQKKSQNGYESLGFFYAQCTILCGFDPLMGEEWKLMGLAAYGNLDKKYYELLTSIYFVDDTDLKLKNRSHYFNRVYQVIEDDLKKSDNAFNKRADLAYTTQLIFSEYMEQLLDNLYKKDISKNLIYTGGCALNSSFNGKILQNSQFESLYVPSAPGDDGNSLGAAYLAFQKSNPDFKFPRTFTTPYLGSEIQNADILNFICNSGYEKVKHFPGTIHLETAKLLAEGKLIGWAQGKAEFGSRALGNRSILADPRHANMKDKINANVKFREEFRPFAPSILAEYGSEYFENYEESPYMERTLKFRKEVLQKVPAVVHLDGTGRLQTVKKEWNEKYYLLIDSFRELTNIPLIINTSFNVMGKPIINSFDDALSVFFNTGLDILVVNDYLFYK